MLKTTGAFERQFGGDVEFEVYQCEECRMEYWFAAEEQSAIRYYELLHVLCGEEEVDIVTGDIVA